MVNTKAEYLGAIAGTILLLALVGAAAALTPEQAVDQIGVSPTYLIPGDDVRTIFNDNGFLMDYPSFALTYRMPIYSMPSTVGALHAKYNAYADILYEIPGGPLAYNKDDDYVYWEMANGLEIVLVKIDPDWIVDPVIVDHRALSSVTIYYSW